ncbi:hypothetical protein [Natronococcus jeotgali]|uniref:Uncharacterized protein n=1 Tax=Natronococcus jeotgali DSM 18795 TaxID=1227498 RepID=L9WUY7_9EURY|nr:hypothetical protein [Natronococcus jeotgali]ELY52153.1 hypothetical protein C492_19856 [Natronococcus jeotgali DSM 18795]
MGVRSNEPGGKRGRSTASDECLAIENRLAARAGPESVRETEHVYWHVVLALERWMNGSEDESEPVVERKLRRSIGRDLRAVGHRSAAASISRPKRSDYCDIVVDGRIGIKIVHNLTGRSREWMHKRLRSLVREYDYLILYGHRIPSETVDVWRQLKRSLERRASDGRRFRAIGTLQRRHRPSTAEADAAEGRRRPFAIGALATLGVVASVALAASGGAGTPSSPSALVLASVVAAVCTLLLKAS